MLASLLVVFREVIEAGLVIGIVMAATRGIAGRGHWVLGGVMVGILGACMLAFFAGAISQAVEGMGQELFNVGILSAAVMMLTWHIVWMARHGREIVQQMKHVGAAVVAGSASFFALATVVAIAVLREGAEIVLFLYGIAISGNDSILSMSIGAIGGLLLGGLLGTLTYLGLLKIPSKHIFKVTGIMLALLAAGMAAQAAALLEQAQVLTAFSGVMWDSSWLLSDHSILGKTLHTLIGYTSQPTAMQGIFYVATLALIYGLLKWFGDNPSTKKVTAPA